MKGDARLGGVEDVVGVVVVVVVVVVVGVEEEEEEEEEEQDGDDDDDDDEAVEEEESRMTSDDGRKRRGGASGSGCGRNGSVRAVRVRARVRARRWKKRGIGGLEEKELSDIECEDLPLAPKSRIAGQLDALDTLGFSNLKGLQLASASDHSKRRGQTLSTHVSSPAVPHNSPGPVHCGGLSMVIQPGLFLDLHFHTLFFFLSFSFWIGLCVVVGQSRWT
jgi:hypothetical protein